MIGNVLDKYEVLQKLGEGGMATVYRGRHMALGRDVAIKVLHPHLSSTERNRLRFAREARAIEDMDHENILKIFDYSGSDAQSCYIVTEFVDGMTLRELLTDRGRLPSEVATMLGIRLAEALSYAHKKKIIHRDLKPENVMLSREGSLKLMDFGIAHFLDEMHLTMTGALVGSPAYMSPEQAMEREDLDHRSDLFSLGTLLFHLVSGQLPFSGSNPSIVLRNIIDGNRPHIMEVVPDISGRFADVIEQLLQTDPDDRFFSAAEVAAELAGALQDVDIDPEQTAWSLEAWLSGPDAFEQRLAAHLSVALMAAGKARLEARDHLEALGLFNRLLSIDEGNEEVLSLIQGMHSLHPEDDDFPEPDGAPGSLRWWAAAVAVPLAAGLLTWALWPTPAVTDITPADDPLASVDARPPSRAHLASAPPEPLVSEVTPPPAPAPEPTPEPEPDGSTEEAARPRVKLRGVPPPRQSSPPGTPDPRDKPDPDPASTAGIEQPDPEVQEAVSDQPGKVQIIMLMSWGDVYIDGELKGRTGKLKEPIAVTPGTHTLEVHNNTAHPYTEEFTVGAGESRQIQVLLQRKPSWIDLNALGLAPGCEVSLDGVALGTVADIGQHIKVSAPQDTHMLQVSCPDGGVTRCTVPRSDPDETVVPSCR